MRMQGYCDVYKWTILKRTSPEVKCLHLTSSRREMCTLSVSNVIYHKFSHGAAFYTLNGKNVNVMLESKFETTSTTSYQSKKTCQVSRQSDVMSRRSCGHKFWDGRMDTRMKAISISPSAYVGLE